MKLDDSDILCILNLDDIDDMHPAERPYISSTDIHMFSSDDAGLCRLSLDSEKETRRIDTVRLPRVVHDYSEVHRMIDAFEATENSVERYARYTYYCYCLLLGSWLGLVHCLAGIALHLLYSH